MCSNNSGKKKKKSNSSVFCSRTSPSASFIRIPRQHRWHESGANRGPLEKIAFQGLNLCGWSRRGDRSLCAHSLSGARGPHWQHQQTTEKTHYGGLGTWWKMLLQISNENPKGPWVYPCSLSITDRRGLRTSPIHLGPLYIARKWPFKSEQQPHKRGLLARCCVIFSERLSLKY